MNESSRVNLTDPHYEWLYKNQNHGLVRFEGRIVPKEITALAASGIVKEAYTRGNSTFYKLTSDGWIIIKLLGKRYRA